VSDGQAYSQVLPILRENTEERREHWKPSTIYPRLTNDVSLSFKGYILKYIIMP
jgi:hypothetical protein